MVKSQICSDVIIFCTLFWRPPWNCTDCVKILYCRVDELQEASVILNYSVLCSTIILNHCSHCSSLKKLILIVIVVHILWKLLMHRCWFVGLFLLYLSSLHCLFYPFKNRVQKKVASVFYKLKLLCSNIHISIIVHHKLFSSVDIEFQVIIVAQCDKALSLTTYILQSWQTWL